MKSKERSLTFFWLVFLPLLLTCTTVRAGWLELMNEGKYREAAEQSERWVKEFGQMSIAYPSHIHTCLAWQRAGDVERARQTCDRMKLFKATLEAKNQDTYEGDDTKRYLASRPSGTAAESSFQQQFQQENAEKQRRAQSARDFAQAMGTVSAMANSAKSSGTTPAYSSTSQSPQGGSTSGDCNTDSCLIALCRSEGGRPTTSVNQAGCHRVHCNDIGSRGWMIVNYAPKGAACAGLVK